MTSLIIKELHELESPALAESLNHPCITFSEGISNTARVVDKVASSHQVLERLDNLLQAICFKEGLSTCSLVVLLLYVLCDLLLLGQGSMHPSTGGFRIGC